MGHVNKCEYYIEIKKKLFVIPDMVLFSSNLLIELQKLWLHSQDMLLFKEFDFI